MIVACRIERKRDSQSSTAAKTEKRIICYWHSATACFETKRPSVCAVIGFPRNLMLRSCVTICLRIPVYLKIGQKCRTRHMKIYAHFCAYLQRNPLKVSGRICTETCTRPHIPNGRAVTLPVLLSSFKMSRQCLTLGHDHFV